MDSEQLRTKLRDLALDLRWSWNHAADELWTYLDPELWALTHNAWVILETVSRERLGACVADAAFGEQLEKAFRYYEYHNTRPHWFQTAYPNSPITAIAYFSMEFMLSDALPIYSGGLGNVAGDQMKAASDLGVPVTAFTANHQPMIRQHQHVRTSDRVYSFLYHAGERQSRRYIRNPAPAQSVETFRHTFRTVEPYRP